MTWQLDDDDVTSNVNAYPAQKQQNVSQALFTDFTPNIFELQSKLI